MSANTPTEPMEHDGSPLHSYPPTGHTLNSVGSAAAAASSSARPPGPLALHDQVRMAAAGPQTHQQGPTTLRRIFCPVVGCAHALTSSNRHYRDFKSIKNHLNDHCTGHISGAVPVDFLNQNSYSQCRICDKLVHTKFQGTCLKCRPSARMREQVDSMRRHNNGTITTPASDQQAIHTQEPRALPSLAEVHERFTPIIKNIPLVLRRLWAQCLVRALAQVAWTNSEANWTELQMLPKCTLCRPTRGGNSHKSKKMAWTRSRLQRWLAGERTSLWQDIPQHRRPQTKEYSGESAKKQRQERCIALTSEGGYSNACKALTSPPPLGQTVDVTNQLREKHPLRSDPIDLSTFGNASSALVPQVDTALVEQCIRSFHRLSGGGPSGLRPIHLKNCLSTELRDEFVERCTTLVNLLSRGDAPANLAPFPKKTMVFVQ